MWLELKGCSEMEVQKLRNNIERLVGIIMLLLQTFVGQADFKTLYMSKVNYKLCLVSDLVVLYPIFNIVLIIIIIT